MEHLPTPFTAEQIRESCRGRRVRTVTEVPEAEAITQVTEFYGDDEDGTWMRAITLAADGSPLEAPREQWATWEDLRLHAQFPAADTTVEAERIRHPLGELDTLRYTLTSGNRRRVFWFASAYPGQPVRYHTEAGAEVVSATNVVESTPIAP